MRKFVPLTLVAAMGCAAPHTSTADQVPVRGESAGYTCRKPADREFVGQIATAELGARMRAEAQARTLRWVPHGAMITMDYSPSRLTVRLDPGNRVLSMSCG